MTQFWGKILAENLGEKISSGEISSKEENFTGKILQVGEGEEKEQKVGNSRNF